MKKNTIAVCDSEAGYAGTLAEYLNNRKKLPFRAEAFTDPEKFCQYAGINHPNFFSSQKKILTARYRLFRFPIRSSCPRTENRNMWNKNVSINISLPKALFGKSWPIARNLFFQTPAMDIKRKSN